MSENINNPKCPKCSSNESSYIFCKECVTYYCMSCHINYYIENNNVFINHNPHCDKLDDMTSIDLSDYDD